MAYTITTSRKTRLGSVDPYQEKINELHARVQEQAQELQYATEAKEAELKEVDSLRERKTKLKTQIADLEVKKIEEQESLSDLITHQKQAVNSSAKELKRKKEAIAAAEGKVIALLINIDHLRKAANDFAKMAEKVGEIRKKYLIAKDKLEKKEKYAK